MVLISLSSFVPPIKVFGLGNKTYEHYNQIGKFFDNRLEELGAERVVQLGLGDDDANLEEDFMRYVLSLSAQVRVMNAVG